MQYSDIMHRFAARHALGGLCENTLKRLYDGDYNLGRARDFIDFYNRLRSHLLSHPLHINKPYLGWFANADLEDAEVRHFLEQTSVLINHLLAAQLQRVINATTLEEMRTAKELLMWELGVAAGPAAHESVEGGTFHFAQAEFERLVCTAEHLGLRFQDLGHRDHGSPSTVFCCDELIRLYGSGESAVREAAAFALENWAACGGWLSLLRGLARFKKRRHPQLPLDFLNQRSQRAGHGNEYRKEQLESYYFTHEFDEDHFIDRAYETLDGLYAFWKGLDDDRRRVH